MRTYERNGIQLEQCGSCRGLFLDFGELEHLTQMEGRFVSQAPPPPGYGPAWASTVIVGIAKAAWRGCSFPASLADLRSSTGGDAGGARQPRGQPRSRAVRPARRCGLCGCTRASE
ncbi:TFIIB-type zinc ribbon-containing protein [Tessaracoccus coleopterorum]|uniref:TFIIB-type zinc ribbon-containing protein n=1 Tax=Tessaracoccus coleopterorum TaxID=2714950 RepID=UPI0018D28438|nr:zf-TFIIB domain-containing protein [Tessaracoccus coleopterorum]